jgi:two-component system sensor histidine kinase ChiS
MWMRIDCHGSKTVLLLGILLQFVLAMSSRSQTKQVEFEHLTVEQGLSSNSVWSIIQDSRGFMWFGTSDGLNKFDGYSFTIYKHDPLDPNSIPENNINNIFQDGSDMLWLRGPSNRCMSFDRAAGKFRSYDDFPKSTHEGFKDSYADLDLDPSGTLWIGTYGKGLKKFDRMSGVFNQYQLSNDSIHAICEDPDENGRVLWGATAHGVDRFEKSSGTFTHYDHGSRNLVNTMRADKFGTIWIGTNDGLYKFDKESKAFSHYQVDKKIAGDDRRNDVSVIYEDSRSILWIGTADGLFRFERSKGAFIKYQSPNSPNSSAREPVVSIVEDRK